MNDSANLKRLNLDDRRHNFVKNVFGQFFTFYTCVSNYIFHCRCKYFSRYYRNYNPRNNMFG